MLLVKLGGTGVMETFTISESNKTSGHVHGPPLNGGYQYQDIWQLATYVLFWCLFTFDNFLEDHYFFQFIVVEMILMLLWRISKKF